MRSHDANITDPTQNSAGNSPKMKWNLKNRWPASFAGCAVTRSLTANWN